MSSTVPHDPDRPAELEAEIDLQMLPLTMRRLCIALGQKAAFEFCRVRGGLDTHVPDRFTSDHQFIGFMGAHAFLALVNEFGGTTISVPVFGQVMARLQVRARHHRVQDLKRKGRGANDIAQLTGYTRRQVTNITRRMDEPTAEMIPQGDLFEEVFDEPSVTAHDPFGLRGRLGS